MAEPVRPIAREDGTAASRGHAGACLLYLVGQLRAGGLERQLVYLLGRMNRAAYRPEVAVWNFTEGEPHVESLRRLGVPIHRAPQGASRVAKLLWFRRLVAGRRPEVVHSYCFFTNFAAFFATKGRGSIAVGSRRNDFAEERRDAGPLLGRLSGRWPRVQISNNIAAVENAGAYSRGVFAPARLFVVRNGIDLEQFLPAAWIDSNAIEILAVGSLIRRKRWDRLLTAAGVLRGRGLNVRVRIMGEGPLRSDLETQARLLQLGECVQFIGYSGEVPNLLAQCAFLVHTSDVEGCPNVVMEAMASGRAVVATDAGETPYLVDDGKTGFVVRREDDALLAERIATLIRDKHLCRQMGEAGRVKAEREFGLDRLVAETLAAYRALGWKGEAA